MVPRFRGVSSLGSQKTVGLGRVNRLTEPGGWVCWTELRAMVDRHHWANYPVGWTVIRRIASGVRATGA